MKKIKLAVKMMQGKSPGIYGAAMLASRGQLGSLRW
jgi:hypothetical protein